jgi:propanol-preferring alcohol dehydrogenase
MRAMVLKEPAPVDTCPLVLEDVPEPEPEEGQIIVGVSVCGVCRTDLHVVEGELPPVRERITPGHQVVGRVLRRGRAADRFQEGQRVGLTWLYKSCGTCLHCLEGGENLCRAPTFTGWHQNGGYAEQIRVFEAFAYPIPEVFGDVEAAPLLCAGVIGFRALRRSTIERGGRLGLYGFGSSAHIALQIARHWGCEVYVCTRGEKHRALARELGAVWVGTAAEAPPVRLDAAILFAPAGELVPPALRALRPGGTLACAGIYMSDIPALDYAEDLFEERTLTSVTAHTRRDAEELLATAAEIPLRPETTCFPLELANQALQQLKQDRINGSAVLVVGTP